MKKEKDMCIQETEMKEARDFLSENNIFLKSELFGKIDKDCNYYRKELKNLSK